MNQKGFSDIALFLVIVLALGVVGYFVFVKKSDQTAQQTPTPAQTNTGISPAPTQNNQLANWKTYSNSKYNFSLKYPDGWTIEESLNMDDTGRVISLRSSETVKGLQERKIDPGYSYDLVVSFWSNINNEYARGGSWVGQRDYISLADFFTDKNAFKQKIGSITVAGQNAYEVSIGGAGANYGVIIEHNGVYELSFETAWDKFQLSPTQKQILYTFQFTK